MLKVTIHRRTQRGKAVWEVYRRENGKRKRSHFASKDTAEQEASRIREQIAVAGQTWRTLTGPERDEAIAVAVEAKGAGDSLRRIWEAHRATPKTTSPKLSTVIAELIAVKEKAGRAEVYTNGLDAGLKQFASGRDAPISSITLADLEKWLDSKNLASRSTLRSRLSTLFKFAVRRGYRLDNPCARLESITAPKAPPSVFTVAQVKACLKWLQAHPKAFPWFVLSCCCGLRPEEAEQTRKADIHAKEGWIKVEAQTTKVRQRRVVYPKPEAMALLAKAIKIRGAKLPLNKTSRRRELKALRKHLKLPAWPKDITRHTAASYWIADCQSAAHVAESLGNSEKVLKRHYQALKTKEEASAFWTTLLHHSQKMARKVRF